MNLLVIIYFKEKCEIIDEMKITYFLLTLLVLGALTYQAQAWLCKGHQLVAQIAYAELESICKLRSENR